MKAKLRPAVAALMLLAPAALTFVAQPALAQDQAALRIQTLTLNANEGLKPGSDLELVMHATPGARATVNFGKTDIHVQLRETASGTYVGHYTVRDADRIDPTAVMIASVARRDSTARHSFTYPPSFQALASGDATVAAAPSTTPPAGVQAAAPPRIERFAALPVDRIEPGRELRYRLRGAPGARATLDIPGVARGIEMREVSPGVYEGSYTIRERDDPDGFDVAIATLRSGNRWTTSRLEHAYVRMGEEERLSTRRELAPRDRDFDRDHDQDRDIARAPEAGTLPLRILSPVNGEVVEGGGRIHVEGRTAPGARLHVRVDAVPPTREHMYGVAETIFDDNIRAEPDGHFLLSIVPRHLTAGAMRYEVSLRARDGDTTAEAHITVEQRG